MRVNQSAGKKERKNILDTAFCPEEILYFFPRAELWCSSSPVLANGEPDALDRPIDQP
jgi:hypothetical protein